MSEYPTLPVAFMYDDIHIGDTVSFEEILTEEKIVAFVDLSGDRNPLHLDDNFAKAKRFSKRIVHGMLLASFFSKLVGMHCPGTHSLYLSQTLYFKKPVFSGEKIIVRGVVVSKSDVVHLVTLQTEILRNEETVVQGEAQVKVL